MLGAQALEALSNGQPVSDQLTIDIIAAAVRSFLIYFHVTYLFFISLCLYTAGLCPVFNTVKNTVYLFMSVRRKSGGLVLKLL